MDRNTRFAFVKPFWEGVVDVMGLLPLEIEHVFISDRAQVFESRGLREWAARRDMVVKPAVLYHFESNGLAELFELRIFINM